MAAVIYIRVSTDEQKLGPKAQQDSCEAFCRREGIEVSAVFVDHGVSGGAPIEKRDGLLDALSDLGRGDVLVVAKRCRLARDVMVSCLIDRAVKARGATVVSADGFAPGDSPESVMMRQILDVFAEYERAVIRARTRAALRQLKKKGKRAGELPFGFQADENNNVVPFAVEQVIIQSVLGYAAGGMSMRGISRRLKVDGLRGRKGFLGHVQVGRILKAHRAKEAA